VLLLNGVAETNEVVMEPLEPVPVMGRRKSDGIK
jgi:hypothetical protein